jgi:hypothetical protein
MARNRLPHLVAYAAVVTVLVAGALSGAAIFFQLTQHVGHAHAGLPPWEVAFAEVVDGIGFALIFMTAVQLMLGYRLIRVPPARMRSVHIVTAWAIAGVVVVHMSGGIVHAFFQGPIEVLPLWEVGIGAVSVVLLGTALVSGYRRTRPHAVRAGLTHGWVAVALALAVSGHGLLGVLHTLTG